MLRCLNPSRYGYSIPSTYSKTAQNSRLLLRNTTQQNHLPFVYKSQAFLKVKVPNGKQLTTTVLLGRNRYQEF
uniref:Uncharacterized protein n=1 Tax=Rhizophora mucronata TaxID=61149 RepID=A0A2P2MYZ1_RHIMU